MAKFSSPSLFTRLYLTIAIAMLVSGAASVIIIEMVHLQDSIDSYVKFTDEIYDKLVKEELLILPPDLKNLNTEVKNVEGFLISWRIMAENGSPCDDCEWVGHTGEVNVYENILRQYFSVYKLPGVDTCLVIFENNLFDFDSEQELAQQSIFEKLSFHDVEEILLLLAVFITVASAVYFPVKVIQRQIEKLIQIQRQFGAGDLQARANEKFTKPIDQLATSFNSMADSISDTVNENQIFAQAVPHEVRTPLSRIQLAVGLLGQNNENTQQIELLDNIDTYIDDISELIDQVVSFSILNSIKSNCEKSLYHTIELNAFVDARISATKCTEKLTVIRHYDFSLQLTTNPAYLRLVVDNLLKNACIHAKKQIVVSLQRLNGLVELSVEDDGDGIPKEYFDIIFTPFARLDVSRSRKTGGLGLGLAIAKAACVRMNSKLSVTNSSTAGAKFICQFPQ